MQTEAKVLRFFSIAGMILLVIGIIVALWRADATAIVLAAGLAFGIAGDFRCSADVRVLDDETHR